MKRKNYFKCKTNMEITIEQITTFSPDITGELDSLLKQLNPNARTLSDEDEKEVVMDKSNRILVAREPINNKIVGLLTLIVVNAQFAKKGLLEDFVVDENYRGKGIGTKLINGALNMARNEKVSYIDLTSSPEKTAANDLYQHLGFKKRITNVYRLEL